MHTPLFGPLLTAMVTPFDSQNQVDYRRMTELADYLLENGSRGLVVVGTTGESPTLTHEEKLTIFKTIKTHVRDRAPVIAGTGSYSTQAAIELSVEAEQMGVDGLLLVNPYYNKPSQEGLFQHFRSIAHAVSIPIILYNHPGRTGVCLSAETMKRLSEIKNIVAIKDSSGDLGLLTDIRRNVPEEFLIYSGDDPLTLPILSIGGYGVISVCSHIVGNLMAKLIESFKQGHVQQAQDYHLQLFDLMRILFCAPSPAPTKAALAMIGLSVGSVRLPLLEVTELQRQQIRSVMEKLPLKSPALV